MPAIDSRAQLRWRCRRIGVRPRGAQVRRTGGVNPIPLSSRNTSHAPRRRALLADPEPVLLDPAGDRLLVALGGSALGSLQGPAHRPQDAPGVRGVMAHAGEAFDHDHHALAGPQVAVEPVRERALQQRPLELLPRAGIRPGFTAGAASSAQGRAAAVLPSAVPAVGVLAGGAQPVSDLGLAGALLEHAGGAQPGAFHVFEVAALTGRWA